MEALPEIPIEENENFDVSMIKCEFISKLIPSLCDSIKEIQLLDKNFTDNQNLTSAVQDLNLLQGLPSVANADEKEVYVNEYRKHLLSGLTKLTDFLNGLEQQTPTLTEEQRTRFVQIATSIAANQEAIANIADY